MSIVSCVRDPEPKLRRSKFTVTIIVFIIRSYHAYGTALKVRNLSLPPTSPEPPTLSTLKMTLPLTILYVARRLHYTVHESGEIYVN
jgi:hypothetical protein